MEIHFEEKKRVAFCGCKQTKNLPSAMGLTRGSNRLRKNCCGQLTLKRPAQQGQQGNAAGGRCQYAADHVVRERMRK